MKTKHLPTNPWPEKSVMGERYNETNGKKLQAAKPGKPTPGASLTLAFDYWNDHGKKGSKVKVISSRKDRRCVSGLRIIIEFPDGKQSDLDARWFSEYDLNFKFEG